VMENDAQPGGQADTRRRTPMAYDGYRQQRICRKRKSQSGVVWPDSNRRVVLIA